MGCYVLAGTGTGVMLFDWQQVWGQTRGQSRSHKGAFGPRRASAAHPQQGNRGLSWVAGWAVGKSGDQ